MKSPLAHPVDPTPRTGGARDTDNLARAVLCALAGGAVLTLNDSFVKTLAADLASGQILALRGAFIYILIVTFALRAGGIATMWRIKSWRGQTLRGICVIGSSFSFVTALHYMPLADTIAIAFAGPLFVTLMAPIILRERVGWRRWSAVLTGFAGVIIIVRPGGTDFGLVALLPICAAFLGGLRDVVTRKMAPTESTVAVLFITTTAVCSAGWMSYFFSDWAPVEWHHVKYLVGSGLLIGVAHYLIIESFRWGEAAVISPLKYGNLLWAALFGYLFFGEVPDGYTILGAAVLVASGLYILRRERKREAA